jgi:hypothetical protein
MSARLLSGGRAPDAPFGDPAVLLPLFHATPVAPRWELGVVLHLSELADRTFEARPKPGLLRHDLSGADGVRAITMVAPPTVDAVRAKIDEIRACRRIVSTSLHGFAIAAAYGVPCLYLGADRGKNGVASAALDGPDAERVNARFVDLLQGYGAREIVYWRQRKATRTDWARLIEAVDAHARPFALEDPDALMAACPAGCAPLSAPAGGTIWDHPLVRATPFDATPVQKAGLASRLLGRAAGGG